MLYLQLIGAEAVARPPPSSTPWLKRIALSYDHATRHCAHWWEDYGRLEAIFAPDYKVRKILPMLVLQVDRENSRVYKAHLGIAGRHIPASHQFSRVYGWNIFYDFRTGPFHQLGLGMESLGARLDFRANLYIPFVGSQIVKTKHFTYPGGFFATNRRYLFSLYGANAEIGYLVINSKNFFLYAAIGPYCFFRPSFGTYIPGGKFRLRPQYRDFLAVDLSVTSDTYCKTVFQVEFILSLPLYQLSRKSLPTPGRFTNRQVYQPIERIDPYGCRCCWQTNF
jgi:hypothetical protein